MTDFEEKVEQLREALFQREEVQRYFSLKRAIEADDELMKTNELLRMHQKEMAKNLHNPKKYAEEKALFEHYSDLYQNHPLVVNYEACKIDVYALLSQLKNILEK